MLVLTYAVGLFRFSNILFNVTLAQVRLAYSSVFFLATLEEKN